MDCLEKIIEYNIEHGFLFFRITSDLIPFASHEVCNFDWQNYFSERFDKIGDRIKENNIRISMHPGQYTVLNSKDENVRKRAISDLEYHKDVLDLMGLGTEAKINIHVGGVYGNKEKSLERFVKIYRNLDESVKGRLIVENDEKSYTVKDCLSISKKLGVPVTFDNLHHKINNNGESLREALKMVKRTWSGSDGLPIVHYSSQQSSGRTGMHAESIDLNHFQSFIEKTKPIDFDLILEIKDKEESAEKVMEKINEDERFSN